MTFDRESCPPRDVLIDAGSPGATAAARERVADHLITCAACADEYRLLQALAPWASEHAHLLTGDARLKGSRSNERDIVRASERDASIHPKERELFRRALMPSYAIAAVLAVIAVALTVQVRRLETENRSLASRISVPPAAPAPQSGDLEHRLADQQRAIADLEARVRAAESPDVNPPIIDLDASDAPRSAAKPAPAALPPGARHVVFVLNTARRRPGATFEVDLVEGADRVVWSGSGLKQSGDGTLTLVVPRSLVGPPLRIRLYSRTASGRMLVEQYAVPASN